MYKIIQMLAMCVNCIIVHEVFDLGEEEFFISVLLALVPSLAKNIPPRANRIRLEGIFHF